MEPTKEEALRAKENAEKLFAVKNFSGSKDYALKAQKLCPELEGISQMVATFEVLDPNGLSTSADVIHLTNGKVQSRKANGKHHMKNAGGDVCSIGYSVYHEPPVLKASRPTKNRMVELGSTCRHGNEETASRTAPEVGVVNGNGNIKQSSQLSTGEILARRCSAAPAFDARKLLIDKARTEIRKKLEEMKLASAAAAAAAAVAENNKKAHTEVTQSSEAPKRAGLSDPSHQPELQKTGSVSIVVPDSDFHDFDNSVSSYL